MLTGCLGLWHESCVLFEYVAAFKLQINTVKLDIFREVFIFAKLSIYEVS